jgi:hypothetical protein
MTGSTSWRIRLRAGGAASAADGRRRCVGTRTPVVRSAGWSTRGQRGRRWPVRCRSPSPMVVHHPRSIASGDAWTATDTRGRPIEQRTPADPQESCLVPPSERQTRRPLSQVRTCRSRPLGDPARHPGRDPRRPTPPTAECPWCDRSGSPRSRVVRDRSRSFISRRRHDEPSRACLRGLEQRMSLQPFPPTPSPWFLGNR